MNATTTTIIHPAPVLRVREISERWLRRRGACQYQRERYYATFGDAPVSITPATIRAAADAGLDIDWVACRILTSAARAEYLRVRNNARDVYNRACADAHVVCARTCNYARTAYRRACANAWEEYRRAIVPARDMYNRACRAALTAYNRACAAARDAYCCARESAQAARDRAVVDALIRIIWGEPAPDA